MCTHLHHDTVQLVWERQFIHMGGLTLFSYVRHQIADSITLDKQKLLQIGPNKR